MNSSAAFTGTSHTSTLIDSISSTAGLTAGMPVQGSGIPVGTTIAAIIDGVSLTLSAATTTSTTGSITYQAVGSPNPQPGTILVKLSDNFSRFYGMFPSFASPISGTPINVTTGTTKGLVYSIVSLGTTTADQWLKLGLPPGVTPAVGASFVAKDTLTATGSGTIEVPKSGAAGIDHLETVGDPSLILSPVPVGGSPNVGGWIVLNALKNTVLTAPVDGTTVYLDIYLNQSSVLVKGE